MKNKIKNILVVSIISFLLVLPLKVQAIDKTYTVNQLRQMYPTGMQWNDNFNGAIECTGFALLTYNNIYGVNASYYAEKVLDVEQVQPGDIVRYNGHSVFILTRNGENVTVVECNYDWNNHVRWDQSKTMSELRNNFSYILKGIYVLGTTPAAPTTPKNVSVDTTLGVKVSWQKSSNCYGYMLVVYDENNNKVSEQEVKKASTTSANIYSLATGKYTVRVYSIGAYGNLSSSYSSTTFEAQQEATSFNSPAEYITVGVGETYTYRYSLKPSNGIAQTSFYKFNSTDNSLISLDGQTVTGLKAGNTQIGFMFKTSRTTSNIPLHITVVGPLKLDKSTLQIEEGNTYKLGVTKDANGEKVSWFSTNKKVATVDSDGNISAVSPGITTIRVHQTVYDENKRSYTILEDECEVVVPDSISSDYNIKLNYDRYRLNSIGETITLKDEKISNDNITWSSSNSKIATVDSNGKVTAVNGGFVKIKATTSKYGSSECLIYVVVLRTLRDGSKVYPGDVDGDGVITATDASVMLDWYNMNLTEDEIAAGDITASGTVNGDDAAVVLDIYKYNDNFYKPGEYKHIKSIILNKDKVTLKKNETVQLVANIYPTDTTDSHYIKWRSSNDKIATVDQSGKVTAISSGTVTITAIANNGNGVRVSCELNVEEEVAISDGLDYDKFNKQWIYYKKGKPDYTYNGFAANSNGTYYVEKGVVTFNYNNLVMYNGKWTAVVNSKLSPAYTGISTNNNGIYYLEKGNLSFNYNGTYKDGTGNIYVLKNSKVDTSFTGLKCVDGIWYYFNKGKTDFTYTGYATNSNETYYLEKGVVTFNYNNLVMYNGKWTAIVNSKLNQTYTGISINKNGSYYLEKGNLSFNYNGTYKDSTGNVYILKNSKVNTSFTGLKCVDGIWYYFNKGKTDLTYNGFASNSNGTYYVNNGKITFKYNELMYYNKKWVAVVNSKVNTSYSGLSSNKNGTYLVIKGTMDFSYTGNFMDSTGKIYNIKNNKVVS